MQAQRQVNENLVYWSEQNILRQPSYSFMREPSLSKTEQASLCKQYMHAIAFDQDKDAYKALYIYFAPKVKTFFKQHANASHAEEMTHEVFIRVWQKANTYQADKANVSTWIFTIARNLKIDLLRQKRIIEVNLDDSHSELHIADGDAHEELVSAHDKIQLSNNFKYLSDEQKSVILKVYYEDKSHQLAAQELDLTLGVIKSRIRSSLKVLRHHLGNQDE
jgi:RNA polymerase sigma-70 factor, ECF subfamily|tara:strand:- start:5994 stop:6653 length:660 start_codon:yes stop_codon:yes gene_type:complete